MLFLYIGVTIVALVLIGIGVYFHWNRNKMKSDPILIGSCYFSGSSLLVVSWLGPVFAA